MAAPAVSSFSRFGRTMVRKPKIVLMDKPLSNLDVRLERNRNRVQFQSITLDVHPSHIVLSREGNMLSAMADMSTVMSRKV